MHAESYKGLVADALIAKLVMPTGGVTLPALSAAGPLVVRFSTDARSEGFYNAAADGAEDNDGFVARFCVLGQVRSVCPTNGHAAATSDAP